MTDFERTPQTKKLKSPELRAAVLDWFEQAVLAFNGLPPPDEGDGQALVAEMRAREWQGKKAEAAE